MLFAVVVGLGALVGCGGGSSDDADQATTEEPPSSSVTTATDVDSTEGVADSTEGDGEAGGGDMCRVVTEAEAEEILGGPVSVSNNTSSEGPLGLIGGCTYRATSDTDAGAVQSIVNIVVVGTDVTVEQFEQQLASDQPDATEVSGVGEQALLLPGGDTLAVFDGGAAMTVQVLLGGEPVDQGVLVEVATNALERL